MVLSKLLFIFILKIKLINNYTENWSHNAIDSENKTWVQLEIKKKSHEILKICKFIYRK